MVANEKNIFRFFHLRQVKVMICLRWPFTWLSDSDSISARYESFFDGLWKKDIFFKIIEDTIFSLILELVLMSIKIWFNPMIFLIRFLWQSHSPGTLHLLLINHYWYSQLYWSMIFPLLKIIVNKFAIL